MSPKLWLPLVALFCLQAPTLAAHSGLAPIDPSESDDEHFVVDTGSGLDTGCTYRDGGPLIFKVKIDRYVGNVKSDGTLENPDLLKKQGVVSSNAQLAMPAFDIDFAQGEIDEVYFNGHLLGTLQGSDGTWYRNGFTVPIEWVKFPAARGENGKPAAAENEIRVDIDKNAEGWCAAIDWGEVSFKAMAPLLLIHGIGANPRDAWEVEPGITEHLTSQGIPFEHEVKIEPNGLINTNAQALVQQIRNIAKSFGVQKVHLVTHSKGSLDSRGYLSQYYNPKEVEVLSLQTLSGPHHGSVLADASLFARVGNLRPVQNGSVVAPEGDEELRNFLYYDWLLVLLGKGPQLPGLADLRTNAMRDFNRTVSLPSDIKFYTYGADADLDGNGDINDAEANPFFPGILGFGNFPVVYNRPEAATAVYHLLRDVSTVKLVPDTRLRINFAPIGGGGKEEQVNEFERVRTSGQINDLAVTDTSSRLGKEEHASPDPERNPERREPLKRWLERNHRNFKHPETMDRVLEKIRRDFPVN